MPAPPRLFPLRKKTKTKQNRRSTEASLADPSGLPGAGRKQPSTGQGSGPQSERRSLTPEKAGARTRGRRCRSAPPRCFQATQQVHVPEHAAQQLQRGFAGARAARQAASILATAPFRRWRRSPAPARCRARSVPAAHQLLPARWGHVIHHSVRDSRGRLRGGDAVSLGCGPPRPGPSPSSQLRAPPTPPPQPGPGFPERMNEELTVMEADRGVGGTGFPLLNWGAEVGGG